MGVRLFPPRGSGRSNFNVAGRSWGTLFDGSVELPAKYALSLLLAGWSVAQDEVLGGQSADFPTSGVVPGFQMFHLGLNKPLWRNVSNSGWVDWSGAAVVP
jgi:hypothetical protein